MGGAPGPRELPSVPSPGVEFSADLLPRLGAFTTQLAAAREREEVGRRRTLRGDGQEFVGYRPYRPGEDLRRFDWDLLARLDRPYVRVHRSEAREDWWIAVDSSASMGVGRPGKLQSAAEAAAATIAAGLRLGARITLVSSDGEAERRPVQLSRISDLGRGLAALGAMTAEGRGGLEALVLSQRHRAAARGCGRALLFGDLLDVDPADVLRLLGGRRRLHLGQVLAPEEWDPSAMDEGGSLGAHAFIDPELGLKRSAGADPRRALEAYEQSLEGFLGRWSELAAAHGISHRVWSSAEPFERFLPDLLR